jgi:hypothetical protein
VTQSDGVQVAYTLVGILCGTIFFQEWKDMSILALCMYAIGFMGMVIGIRVGISAKELTDGLKKMDEGDLDVEVSDGASGQHSHYPALNQRFVLFCWFVLFSICSSSGHRLYHRLDVWRVLVAQLHSCTYSAHQSQRIAHVSHVGPWEAPRHCCWACGRKCGDRNSIPASLNTCQIT